MVDSYYGREFPVGNNGDREYLLESLITRKEICKRELSAQASAKIFKCERAKEFHNLIHSEKFDAPTCAFENLGIGFYGPPRGTRFVIRDETTLAEAYSTEKNKWMVIWAWSPPGKVASRKRSCTFQGTSGTASNPTKRSFLSSKCYVERIYL